MHPRTYHSDGCSNPMPASAGSAHWREWHRGHGCGLDDSKPRLLPVEKEWSPYPVTKEQSK